MGNDSGKQAPPDAVKDGSGRALHRMNPRLQQRMAGGVDFNFKVVVRGERGSGKTALVRRLQAQPFEPNYTPTPEIETATISWRYKGSDDVVKVEVWDVVDKARNAGDESRAADAAATGDADAPAGVAAPPAPEPGSGGDRDGASSLSLDAETINVNRGAQAVVIVVDSRKADALDYAEGIIADVPDEASVLLLASHWDAGEESRQVTRDQLKAFAQQASLRRRRATHARVAALLAEGAAAYQASEPEDSVSVSGEGGVGVRAQQAPREAREWCGSTPVGAIPHCGIVGWAEASMADCYGLKALYNFLNVPFLQAKRQTQLQAVAAVEMDIAACAREADLLAEQASYDAFLRQMQERKQAVPVRDQAARTQAKAPAKAQGESPTKAGSARGGKTSAPAPARVAAAPAVTSGAPVSDVKEFAVGQLDDSFFDDDSDSGSDGETQRRREERKRIAALARSQEAAAREEEEAASQAQRSAGGKGKGRSHSPSSSDEEGRPGVLAVPPAPARGSAAPPASLDAWLDEDSEEEEGGAVRAEAPPAAAAAAQSSGNGSGGGGGDKGGGSDDMQDQVKAALAAATKAATAAESHSGEDQGDRERKHSKRRKKHKHRSKHDDGGSGSEDAEGEEGEEGEDDRRRRRKKKERKSRKGRRRRDEGDDGSGTYGGDAEAFADVAL